MRMHVTPVLPESSIPDPTRGRDLPAEGVAVEWAPYWAGLLLREEITATEIVEPDPETNAALEAVHRGKGSYSVMRGGAEILEGMGKAEAEAFNALSEADKAAFLADHAQP